MAARTQGSDDLQPEAWEIFAAMLDEVAADQTITPQQLADLAELLLVNLGRTDKAPRSADANSRQLAVQQCSVAASAFYRGRSRKQRSMSAGVPSGSTLSISLLEREQRSSQPIDQPIDSNSKSIS